MSPSSGSVAFIGNPTIVPADAFSATARPVVCDDSVIRAEAEFGYFINVGDLDGDGDLIRESAGCAVGDPDDYGIEIIVRGAASVHGDFKVECGLGFQLAGGDVDVKVTCISSASQAVNQVVIVTGGGIGVSGES